MESLLVLMPQEKGGLWQEEIQTGNESGEQVSSTVLPRAAPASDSFPFLPTSDLQLWVPRLWPRSFQVSQLKFPSTERLLASPETG